MTLEKVTGLLIGLTRTLQQATIKKYLQYHGKSRGILSSFGDDRFFPYLIQECPLDQDPRTKLGISLCPTVFAVFNS
jgi:hypothetical protein